MENRVHWNIVPARADNHPIDPYPDSAHTSFYLHRSSVYIRGQTQNTATATQTQPNTAAAQNVYGAQQGYTYGAYDTNAQNNAYYQQNAYYNNAQANPYNTNYYTQTSQQTTSSENNYYNSQVSAEIYGDAPFYILEFRMQKRTL